MCRIAGWDEPCVDDSIGNAVLPSIHSRREVTMAINLDRVTIEDCLDNYNYKDVVVLINDGKIINFKTEQRKSTTRADQSN